MLKNKRKYFVYTYLFSKRNESNFEIKFILLLFIKFDFLE